MDMYKRCKYLTEQTLKDATEATALLPSVETGVATLPSVLLSPSRGFPKWLCNRVFYISDVHLAHKVAEKFKRKATDEQIKRYVRKIAKDLVTGDLSESIENDSLPIVIFGGDISSYFDLAEAFYTEFIEQWEKTEKRLYRTSQRERYIYAILGNHEFWDFETTSDCIRAYKKLFKRLGINFLHNTVTWFGDHDSPKKQIGTIGDRPVYTELQKADDEDEYNRQMGYIHNTLIIGGVGFAGCNDEFNADMGIYREALNRKQEIAETKKWIKAYNDALSLAKETDSVLVVLSHNPISDWKHDGQSNSGCVYFTGHSHRNFLSHDEENNIHIFANNQIGYDNPNVKFKEAYIYGRANPFAKYSDGYHEITSTAYLRFYDYMNENISGNGFVDHQIKTNNAKFYMIKHSGYYGFFLVSNRGTCICAGGRITKISKCTDIEQFDADFLRMIRKYIKVLSPYRNAQEQIAEGVKSFGGEGTIHGCIIDIDFLNHIMLNPSDGSITYYYSPMFGQVEIYDNLLALLENHNEYLATEYRKQLKSADNGLLLQDQVVATGELIQIDIKNSVYAVSNRMNQLQRLFDKKILRAWSDDLLLSDVSDDMLGLPE